MGKPNLEKLLIDYIWSSRDRFYLLAYSYVKNEQDALDIVQDSIQKALTNLHTLQDQAQIKSWFYTIVVRTSIDFLRRHKRITSIADEAVLSISEQVNDVYEDSDLHNALDQLPDIYREVIILRYFEDLKIGDVAKALDINTNTVKSRLYKALKILKIELQEHEGAAIYE